MIAYKFEDIPKPIYQFGDIAYVVAYEDRIPYICPCCDREYTWSITYAVKSVRIIGYETAKEDIDGNLSILYYYIDNEGIWGHSWPSENSIFSTQEEAETAVAKEQHLIDLKTNKVLTRFRGNKTGE